jgi:predicted permease
VLVVSAGLMVQSLLGLRNLDLGFEPQGLFTWRTSIRENADLGPAGPTAYIEEVERRVGAVPGIEAVGSASFLPPLSTRFVQSFTYPALPARPGSDSRTITRAVTPGYLPTMGIRVLAGRGIDRRDSATAPAVAVINDTFRSRYFPTVDPIGQTMTLGPDALRVVGEPREMTIVGVVADVITSGSQPEPAPAVYFPQAQSLVRVMNVVMRTSLDPLQVADDTERAIWAVGGDQNVYAFQTLEQAIADTQWQTTFSTFLLGCFAGLALLLGVSGIYAVVSHSVSGRTAEIGLRMALGAAGTDILRLVLGSGLRPVVLGVALGLAGALATSRLLTSVLFGVRPADPTTFAIVASILVAAAVVATWVPARRAARVDPTGALRA